MKRFKNKNNNVIVVARTNYDENILRSNPNYVEFNEEEPKAKKDTLSNKKVQKVANKPL